ncbi:meteorin-like protein [Harmonia axyridis]|uniref:meteorin-like protein n=1 Tax=Harmonia axyridis TaxID=115357 RepID=UPI001E275D33|nr:meteorin-like protein [Harmonia axyridis]
MRLVFLKMCNFWKTSLSSQLVLLGCMVVLSSASILGDECDWTGSGLSTSTTERGVTPVYLRCRTGRITWLYPRGALRVLLRLPGQDRDFRACIKVREDANKPSARLFLEGPRSLLKLYSHNDGSTKTIRCFNSKKGQAAIYVEALENDGVSKIVADIEYDLQPLPRGIHSYDPNEECRPCTSEELAHAFCTSDLVTRGIIHGVEQHHTEELSQMSVKITKLIRNTVEETFSNKDVETNEIPENEYDEADKKITISVAQHCGVAHGVGEFVFMARRKLGGLRLQCAPRLEDWAKLISTLSEEGKAHCVLRS